MDSRLRGNDGEKKCETCGATARMHKQQAPVQFNSNQLHFAPGMPDLIQSTAVVPSGGIRHSAE